MLTRFISDSAWGSPDYRYPYDDTVSLKSTKIHVAGNLNVNYSPFLNNLQEFANNNYSCFYITENKNLSSLLTVSEPNDARNNKSYGGLLGVFFGEDKTIQEQTRFLSCKPLYRHINDFSITYASYLNTFADLEGGSLIFSSVDPVLSGFEIGFRFSNPGTTIYNRPDIYTKFSVLANTNMATTVRRLSNNILARNFCTYLSGYSHEFGVNQTYQITISSRSGTWNTADLRGYAFVIGNTQYGQLTSADIQAFYRRFAFTIQVAPNLGLFPPGYNRNEVRLVPNTLQDPPIPPVFTQEDTIETVCRTLTGIFDNTKTGNDFYESSIWYGVDSFSFDNNVLRMTVFGRSSGSVVEPPAVFDLLNTNKMYFRVDTVQEGRDAGFFLRFGPVERYTTVDFVQPGDYQSINTIDSLSANSDLYTTVIQNRKEYAYEPEFIRIFDANNNIFLDLNFINENELIISHTLYKRKAYLVSDDLNKELFFVDGSFITESNLSIAKFNYVYDEENDNIIIYRKINGAINAIGSGGLGLRYYLISNLENVPLGAVFTTIRHNKVATDFYSNIWASYRKTLNTNNININPFSIYNIKNNFLFHTEYNKINESIDLNFIPLKNQLNDFYHQGRTQDGPNFRNYHSLYTGDNTEEGNYFISLGYTSSNKEYVFKSGNITWFHIPYNDNFERININDANFALNGAIPGQTPVFGDKIWKKAGDYRDTTNFGNSRLEQTGQWLCSWLSGSDDGSYAEWMDRFYNPEIITLVDAIRVTNNIDYIPSYKGKGYLPGISDRPSTLKLEPGCWFAYQHVGKNDAEKVINYLRKDLIQESLSGTQPDQNNVFNFDGNKFGYLSIENFKAPPSNFSLSFHGYSDDWSKPMGSQILGNYLDSGFGIFNFKEINPFTYYFNQNKVYVTNNTNDVVFSVTLPPSERGKVVGAFIRNYHENFHLILDNCDVLEYNLEGTLVDAVTGNEIFVLPELKNPISVCNNNNIGAILFQDFSYCIIDLKTNVPKYFNPFEEAEPINTSEGPVQNIVLDSFNKVYLIAGRCPVVRDEKIYFIDPVKPRLIRVYNTLEQTTEEYIDTSTLESIPLSPKSTFYFRNRDQTVSEFPYNPFNLNALSGMGIILYPPNRRPVKINLSIYRDPYIFNVDSFNEGGEQIYDDVLVDLNGNYWQERDKLQVIGDDVFGTDKFGYSHTIVGRNNMVFLGDPFFNEQLGSTARRYGRVNVYNLKNYKMQQIGSIDIGPRPQIYNIRFNIESVPSNTTIERILSAFPVSTNLILSNGTDILSHPLGEGNVRYRQVSAFSLGFSIYGSAPNYGTENISTRINYTFTPPLTSMRDIMSQMFVMFNRQNIIPTYTGNVPLSTFFTFTLAASTNNSFDIEIKNKFEGLTPLSAGGGVRFRSTGSDATSFITSFTAVKNTDGQEPQGQVGQQLGYEVKATIDMSYYSATRQGTNKTLTEGELNRLTLVDEKACDLVAVASPAWSPGNTIATGKVDLFADVLFDNNDFFPLTAYTLVPYTNNNFAASANARFGHSLALHVNTVDTSIRPMAVIAASTNFKYSPSTPTNFVRIYTYPGSKVLGLVRELTGPSIEEYGYKIDVNNDLFVISRPLANSSRGRLTVYPIYRPAGSSDLYPFFGASPITINAPTAGRHRFGYSLKLNEDNLLAVVSLSSSEAGRGNITLDVYDFNKINSSFTRLTSIYHPFLNNGNLSAIDVDMNKTHLVVSCWVGDEEDAGDEKSRVLIYYIKDKKFNLMYDDFRSNDDRGIFKTFHGRRVSLARDRLITGTSFIYNTGHSVVYAASAINTALQRQTGIYDAYISAVDEDRLFYTTFVTLISSEELTPPITFPHTNRQFRENNTLTLHEFFKGSELNYSGRIINYAFDIDEKTQILTDYDRIKTYNVLGEFTSTYRLSSAGLPPTLSCIRFGISNLIKNQNILENYSLLGVDRNKDVFKGNFDKYKKSLKIDKIDSIAEDDNGNPFFFPAESTFENIVKNNFDITNGAFMAGVIRPDTQFSQLTYKLRLNNRLDYEEGLTFSPIIATQNLNNGWHHFVISVDLNTGHYKGYIDSKLIFDEFFEPNKYTFSTILKSNILVGSSPFYNNVPFDNFYRSSDSYFLSEGIKFTDIKFYNKALTPNEVKFLGYLKTPPRDMKYQLNYNGSRNYVDTISKVFAHKVPGKKSSLINIVINDSLITNRDLQKFYETKLLSELKEYMPGHLKVNKFIWKENKPNEEKILEGDINIGNTLTYSGDLRND